MTWASCNQHLLARKSFLLARKKFSEEGLFRSRFSKSSFKFKRKTVESASTESFISEQILCRQNLCKFVVHLNFYM